MSEHELNIVLTLFGFTLLALGLVAGIVRNYWIVSEPLLALCAGAVAAFIWPDLLQGNVSLAAIEQTARVTLTIALLDVATNLPRDWLRRHWNILAVMLGIVMPLMWLISWSIAAVLPGLSVATAMLVAAVITPTDPVLAASIATGQLAERHVPAGLRHTIIAESGANDMLALLLVSFALLVAGDSESSGVREWFVNVGLKDIGGGIVIGIIAGWLTARALAYVSSKPYADRASLITVALALAAALLGTARLIGSDGVLAAFVAGLMLNQSLPEEMARQKSLFHETVRRFFELPVFILLGLVLPWSGWMQLGVPAVALTVLVLLARRLPAVWLCSPLIASVQWRRDVLFLGWFGPIGIAALYYAAMVTRRTGDDRIWQLASLIVAASVLVHGLSGTTFTKWYGSVGDAGGKR